MSESEHTETAIEAPEAPEMMEAVEEGPGMEADEGPEPGSDPAEATEQSGEAGEAPAEDPVAGEGGEEPVAEASAPLEAATEDPGDGPPPTGAEVAAKAARTAAASPAHVAFIEAVRVRAERLGLRAVTQTSYLQVADQATGHKVYVALSAKTRTVHVETTLPVHETLEGAVAPLKKNGRIAAVLDVPVEDPAPALRLLAVLAAGEHGPLPPPTRRTAA